MTRAHVHSEEFPVSPDRLFAILTQPSAIRSWWSASRAIVVPAKGGTWAAAWGEDEDDPDYVTVATLSEFEPPKRRPDGARQIFLRDPDGYFIEICELP